jgi:hypothetical protein
VLATFRFCEQARPFSMQCLTAGELRCLPEASRSTRSKPRCRVITRFVDSTNEYPWGWRANDVDQFLAELRSQATPIALSTLRAYSNAISMF